MVVQPTSESDQDPRIIEIHYRNVVEAPGYVQPLVQVEVGCRSLMEPYSIQRFGSLVDETFQEAGFFSSFIEVPTVHAERTFLEKLFLLHEEFHRPVDKMRVDRLSRHLYDIYQLSRLETATHAINDKHLYETIVAHRYKYARIGGVDYNGHSPETLDPMPHPKIMKAWSDDYTKMLEQMIYENDPPTFDDLIENIVDIRQRLTQIDWKYDLEFPIL